MTAFDKTVEAFIEARRPNTDGARPPRNVRSRAAQQAFREMAESENFDQFTPKWSERWWEVMDEVWTREAQSEQEN